MKERKLLKKKGSGLIRGIAHRLKWIVKSWEKERGKEGSKKEMHSHLNNWPKKRKFTHREEGRGFIKENMHTLVCAWLTRKKEIRREKKEGFDRGDITLCEESTSKRKGGV